MCCALLAVLGMGIALAAWPLPWAPGELLRHAERRLQGHPKLEWATTPIIGWLRPRLERPASDLPVQALPFAGQQPGCLPPQTYRPGGAPEPARASPPSRPCKAPEPPKGRLILVTPGEDFAARMQQAQAGDVFEFLPGTHPMARSVRLNQGGTAQQPVLVRGGQPGQVTLLSTASEGFVVQSPHWVFENLTIRGVCPEHSNCEHAFHVTGLARNVVIRNNAIEDFNAQIKVNGIGKHWPDHGLIQHNTLVNHQPRLTAHPVTPVDIVGASGWQVLDNRIADFVKADGNGISYGVFHKGGGEDGVIARNQIVCTTRDISQPGVRIGASLGGGGSDRVACRDGKCITEHSRGRIEGNWIAHCNDYGIYINQANQSLVTDNTLINTYGIDVRFPTASARLLHNRVQGIVRAREGAHLQTH